MASPKSTYSSIQYRRKLKQKNATARRNSRKRQLARGT